MTSDRFVTLDPKFRELWPRVSRIVTYAVQPVGLCLRDVRLTDEFSSGTVANAGITERIAPLEEELEPIMPPVSGEGRAEIPTTVLFLPTYKDNYDNMKAFRQAHVQCRLHFGKKSLSGKSSDVINMFMGDPPYQDDSIVPVSYYLRPHANSDDARRKLLRKQLLASIVCVLIEVMVRQPRILIGYEQGAVIVACMSRPLLVEVACRARLLTSDEMRRIRQAWARVVALIVWSPQMMPHKHSSTTEDLFAAVPEFNFAQPRGFMVVMVRSDEKSARPSFVQGLANHLGIEPC